MPDNELPRPCDMKDLAKLAFTFFILFPAIVLLIATILDRPWMADVWHVFV
jgi:hypothetical protein